ncbi:trans-2-enoyl-CoA reductase-like protein [Sporormia fimetaria CBS 119925]|uniref:enoyl-[acyl-carrier-protein] reductase n=1 Tax=Sporormia fimetaria CBS 119925 TaxID=1340428 RepID=A0A6A6V3M2_9PLEO|nr:trans-2-enoyl-CoA reductase-like protein [Sporormia fimetaria CBS 119925]
MPPTTLLRRTTLAFPRTSTLSTQTRTISAYGYTQSKALTFRDYGDPASVLSLHKHSISPPHGSALTLRFLASPINPADINQIQGVYPSKPTFTTSLGTAHPLAVGGNEGVAEVIALGDAAKQSGFAKGDWVFMRAPGFGTWRTHAAAEAGQLVKLREEAREGISAVQAGTVSVNPCTAYQMLRGFGNLKEGQWFMQNGANSGVGRAAIQLAKVWGYKSINVIRSRTGEDAAQKEEELKEELKAIGADVVITDAELQAREMRDRIKEITNGGRERIGLALNCVSGKPAIAMAKLVGAGADFVTYGAMSKQPLTIPASLLIFKDIRFHGFWVSRWSEQNPEDKVKMVEHVLELTRKGEFRDSPMDEIRWEWETTGEELVEKVAQTLEGYRSGKGVFVFGDSTK